MKYISNWFDYRSFFKGCYQTGIQLFCKIPYSKLGRAHLNIWGDIHGRYFIWIIERIVIQRFQTSKIINGNTNTKAIKTKPSPHIPSSYSYTYPRFQQVNTECIPPQILHNLKFLYFYIYILNWWNTLKITFFPVPFIFKAWVALRKLKLTDN